MTLIPAVVRTPCRYYASPGGCRAESGRCPNLHYNDFGFGALHVPWSGLNTFSGPTGKRVSHWNLVVDQLFESNVTNTSDLTELLVDLLPPPPNGAMKHKVFPTDFQELVAVLDEIMTRTESSNFFHHVLPFIKNMCIRCPSLFSSFEDGAIPILRQGVPGVVRLTELQVLGLLSCAFMCLFPGRHRTFSEDQFMENAELKRHTSHLGFVNFGSLFGFHQPQARQKIRCFIAYFETQYLRRRQLGLEDATTPSEPLAPVMHIELIRTVLGPEYASADALFAASKRPLAPVVITSTGTIEDAHGLVQADFANHVLGGGVLARGCVQEEIRFATSPELLLSRLLCESLRDNEALIMNGAATFSQYTGYASSFQFAGHETIKEPTPEEARRGMRDVSVVAFDAVNYCVRNLQPVHQYLAPWQQRDIIKALAAFIPSRLSSLPSAASNGAVATGNWGCGAFGGDVQLKLVQQWIAASLVGRPLRYFTFANEDLCVQFAALEKTLRAANATVGDVYRTVLMYVTARTTVGGTLQRLPSLKVPEAVLPGAEDADLVADLLDDETVDYMESGELHAASRSVSGASSASRHQTVVEYLVSQFSS